MLKKDKEKRAREITRLVTEGYKYKEIASKLDISERTVKRYVKIVNTRYVKQVAENPQYIEKQQDRIMEFLRKYDHLSKSLYDIINTAEKHRTDIEYIVNTYRPEIKAENGAEQTREETIKIDTRNTERKLFRKQLQSIAHTNATLTSDIYMKVKGVLDSQTKILKLVSASNTNIQVQNDYNIQVNATGIILDKIEYIMLNIMTITEEKKAAAKVLQSGLDELKAMGA